MFQYAINHLLSASPYKWCRAAMSIGVMSMVTLTHAAYINRNSPPIIANGAMTFTGNTIGLNKAPTSNAPGTSGAIGAFIAVRDDCTLNTTLVDGTYPAGTTADYKQGGSCATLDLPVGATVRYAELIWSGSYQYGNEAVGASLNDPVTLIRPNGTTTPITPDSVSAQTLGAPNAAGQCTGTPCFYARSANVTSLITAGGSYGVRGIPATQANAEQNSNTGGWTLAVIYELSSLPARAMNIFVGAERGGNAAASITGFCTPNSPTQAGRLLVSALEGDSFGGDEMRFGSTAAILASASGLLSGPNNPSNNFFLSQINKDDGNLDTRGSFGTSNSVGTTAVSGARQGYDITNVDISSKIIANQTSALAQGTTTSDQYMINALGVQIDVGAPKFPVTTKTVDRTTASVGDILTYTVKMKNEGTALARNVRFQDPVPAGLRFVAGSVTVQKTLPTAGAVQSLPSADPGVGFDVGSGADFDITVAEEYTVTFRARVDAAPTNTPAQFENQAKWTYRFQSCVSTPFVNSESITNPVVTRTPKLSITKASSAAGSVSTGDIITYTITVRNDGSAPTSATTLQDTWATGTTYQLGSTTLNGASFADVSGQMPFFAQRTINSPAATAGVINPGESAVVTFRVTVTSTTGSPITNTALADIDGPGPAAAIQAQVTNNLLVPDLTIAKTAVGQFVRGANAQFDLAVSNTGAGRTNGTAVIVTDTLPAGLQLSAAPSGSGWTCTGAAGQTSLSCSRSDALNGGNSYPPIAVPVLVLQSTPASLTNTASVSGGGDATAANASATVTVTSSANLSVTKQANPTDPAVGAPVTFTVTVRNAGPSDAANARVADALPTGFTLVSSNASIGTYTSASDTWTIGTVASGGTATLQVVATFTGVVGTNTAAVTSDTPDPDATNNSASVTVPSKLADLQLLKAVDNASPNVGGNVTFTLTTINAGPDASQSVTVLDRLPAGLTFVSATPAGAYDSATGVWTVGTIAPSTSSVLRIVARVDVATPITNVAEVASASTFDPNSTPGNGVVTENDYASATITPRSADLRISKTVSEANPLPGERLDYTVSVTNSGPSEAASVIVNETLPAGISFLAGATANIGSYNSTTGVWTIGTLASGATATLTLPATFNGPGQITNTASVTSATNDPDTSSNTASVTVPAQLADLALSKTASTTTPSFGDVVTFTVTASNLGPSNATGVAVQDRLPTGLTFVSATPSVGTYDQTSGNWVVGAIAANSAATLTIRARVIGTAPITNTAQVTQSDQIDPNSTPNNSNAAENDQASVTITPVAADLQLTKLGDKTSAVNGDPVAFTLTVRNLGPSAASAIVVDDVIPAGLTFVSASPSVGTYDSATGRWTIGALANAGVATLQINVTYNASGTLVTNGATVSSATVDPVAVNNTAQASVRGQTSELAITKQLAAAGDASLPLGDEVTYLITVTNNGPDAASNIRVADALPATLMFVSSNATAGSYAAGSGLWFIPNLPAAAGSNVATLTLKVKAQTAPACGSTIGNSASILGASQFDNALANNQTPVINIVPQCADIAVTKTASPTNPRIGQQVIYTITATNNGPSDALGVQLTDSLPAGLTYVSDNSGGAYVPATGVWTVGSVVNGTNRQLQITATFNGPSQVTNVATLSASRTPDFTTSNNSGLATVPAQIADIAITKLASVASASSGQTVSFTITARNLGPAAATTLTVEDNLPAGFTVVSTTPSQGSFAAGVWTVGTVAANSAASLIVTGTISGSVDLVNTARLRSMDQFDPSTTNDAATATIRQQRADLSLQKTADTLTPDRNGVAKFTLRLSNAGPDRATNVVITDALPAGLTFIAAAPLSGSFDSATGRWSVPSLDSGSSTTIEIITQVTGSTPITNSAQIAGSDQVDPSTGNNSSNVTVTPQSADVSVVKTASNTSPLPGQTVRFIIVASNAASSTGPARNIVVTDILPTGLTFISSNPSTGTYDASTGLWQFATLAVGASETLTIDARFIADAVINRASINTDSFDPSTANNSSAVALAGQLIDIRLAKTASNLTPLFGDTVVFTVSAANDGPAVATNLSIEDVLPATLELVSVSTTNGTFTTPTWTIGNLSPTITATLTVTARVRGTTAITNTARVVTLDQVDRNPSNDQASVTISPIAADVSLSKRVSKPAPENGESVIYTLTATNTGPSTATNVVVNELLPAGLTYVSHSTSQGPYVATTGIWQVGSLANGARASLNISAIVTASGLAVTNSATITSDTPDPAPSDNRAEVTIPGGVANLSLAKRAVQSEVALGGIAEFEITVSNAGPDSAVNVAVKDRLPVGLEFVSAQASNLVPNAYDPVTGVWQVGAVAAGGNSSLRIRARLTSAQAVTNTAQVIASSAFDPNSTPNNSDANEDDQASATITPLSSDLSIAKTVSNPNPTTGDRITFTITVRNAGPSAAARVRVNEPIAAGLNFVSANASVGTYSSTTGLWQIGDLAANAQATLTLTVDFVASGFVVRNVARVESDTADPNTANNVAAQSIPAQIADLQLSKTVDQASPALGSEVSFTLRVSNAGPDAATGIAVNDVLPVGLAFVNATASQGAYDSVRGVWAVGAAANGGQASLTIRARVTALGTITNTAEVSASDQFDPNSTPNNGRAGENDQASVSLSAIASDVSVRKSVSPTSPAVGATVRFTVTASNAGPAAATGVVVRDPMPEGFTLVRVTPSIGTLNADSSEWTIGTLAAGQQAEAVYEAIYTAAGRVITNTASIRADQTDPAPTNNIAVVRVPASVANLSLRKAVNNAAPAIGATVTYTITLNNAGPDTATNVDVRDTLPSGVTFTSATPSVGTFDSATGLWRVASLAANQSATLQIAVRVAGSGTITNVAEVTRSDQTDPNSAPGNGVAGEDDIASVVINVPAPAQIADLSLRKTAGVSAAAIGDVVTFTVTISNAGPNDATNVLIREALPAGLALTGTTPSVGSFDTATNRWRVDRLASGASATLQVSARITASGTLTNIVEVMSSDQRDPNATPGNGVTTEDDYATATVTAGVATSVDLQIAKRLASANLRRGNSAEYVLSIANRGTAPTVGSYTVTDTLPAGLTATDARFVENGWSCEWLSNRLACTRSDVLAAGVSSGDITVRVNVATNAPETITNIASVAGGGDVNTANNAASAAAPVLAALVATEPVPLGGLGWLMALGVMLIGAGAFKRRRQ